MVDRALLAPFVAQGGGISDSIRPVVESNAPDAVYIVIVIGLFGVLVGGATGRIPDGVIGEVIKKPLMIGVLLAGLGWAIVNWVISNVGPFLEGILNGINL